jgi:shikimate dehydrogenase
VIRAHPGAGVTEVGVANRSADRAGAAIALGGPSVHEAVGADASGYDVVVNATSVGMGVAATDGVLPLPEDQLRPGHVVVDLVYEPVDTGLLTAARLRGATVVDGVGMLVHQAAHAFGHWTGLEAPIAVMTTAAREALDAKT